VKSLTVTTFHLTDPTKAHCIGCRQVIEIAFALWGKLWGQTSFRTVETEECIWNPKLQRLDTVITEKSVPIESYATGYICESCLTTRCIERKRRDGSVYKVPRCIITAKPTATTSINPGFNRRVDFAQRTERESRPVNLKRGTDGPGALLWDPLTDQVRQEVEPTVNAACYQKFGGR
jgi:hypothetical protein